MFISCLDHVLKTSIDLIKELGFTYTKEILTHADQFIYLGSNISSTESNVNIRIRKAWIIIDKLSII